MAGLIIDAGKGISNATHKATIRSEVGLDTAHNPNNNVQNEAVGYSTSFHTGQRVSNLDSKEKDDFDYVVVNGKNGEAEGYITSLIDGELIVEDELTNIDQESLDVNIKKLRDIADRYEDNANKIMEASTYCTTKDLSVLGIGVEDRITDCAANYKEMAKKIREYANMLEAQLQGKKEK